LSQCNSFVVMRISNPEDQAYVSKVVGDHFAGVIQMLPVLRPGEGFVIGDSVLMPMRTLIYKPDPTPQSGDVDFFRLWAASSATSDIDDVINHWRLQDRQHLNQFAPDDEEEAPAEAGQQPAESSSPPSSRTPFRPPGVPAPPTQPFQPQTPEPVAPSSTSPPTRSRWLVGS